MIFTQDLHTISQTSFLHYKATTIIKAFLLHLLIYHLNNEPVFNLILTKQLIKDNLFPLKVKEMLQASSLEKLSYQV